MLRKLAIAIAASGAMMSASTTYALGMGDIELDSALNQPLDARIKLLKASELEDWEIKPNLASREEFEKSGVERVFFLNSFKFEIERTDSGVFVNLSSDQPVVEPFLNFLVQVDWPSGRLLREYTLLLDPPVFTEAEPDRVSAPVEQETQMNDESAEMMAEADGSEDLESTDLPGTGSYEDETITEAEPETDPEVIVAEKPKPKTYGVRKNDTLWEVAIKTRADRSVTPQQAMLAIQDMNPSAFINGNINRLKKNQVLRVPTKEQMLSRSFSEAVSEVAMQNQAIAQRKAQLDATRKDQAMTRDDTVSDARLKLLAGGDATTDVKRGAGGKVLAKAAGDQSNLENDLNLALENLDKSTLENQELRTRLDSLEEQINTLQRLINLKDEQMVALQTGVSAVDSKEAVDQVEKPVQTKGADGDLNFVAEETDVANISDSDVNKVDGEVKPAPVDAVDADDKKVKPKPKFVYTPPVEEEEPFDVVAFAIENPQIPGAVILALLLALMAVSRARKRKEEAQEEIAENQLDARDPLDDVDADLEDDFNSGFDDLDLGGESDAGSEFNASEFDGSDFDTDALDDFGQTDSGLPDSLDDTDLGEGQDVLGEVDVYMAYNRVEPAKELLEKTLQQQPGRNELRVKLLEVLSEMDDQEGFTEQFDQLMSSGNESEKAQAEAIKSRFASTEVSDLSDDLGMGLEAQDSSMGGLGLDLDEGELDFDLDGLDLSSDMDAPSQESATVKHDSDLDFDMDLSDFDSGDSDSQIETLSLDDTEFDSGLDFSSSLDSQRDTENKADLDLGSNEEFDLDLGELDTDTSIDLGSELESSFDTDDLPSLDRDDALDALLLDDTEAADLESGLELDDGLSFNSSDIEIPELDSEVLSSNETDDLDFSLDTELDVPSLDNELSLDSGLDVPSLEDELSLDSLDDELAGLSNDLELNEGSESDDFDLDGLELDGLDLDGVDSDSNTLDLDEGLEVSIEPTTESEDLELGGSDSDDLVELGSLDEADDLPPLGDLDLDEDLDFLSGTDESETKLDLARAYIDMDDKDGAKEILQEVLEEGTDQQKEDAGKLMDGMG